jgi:hypothetical protein
VETALISVKVFRRTGHNGPRRSTGRFPSTLPAAINIASIIADVAPVLNKRMRRHGLAAALDSEPRMPQARMVMRAN